MRVKFKSKEAYETYKRTFTINEKFCELISFDDEFFVPSLDDEISVEEFSTINDEKLWDLDRYFFEYKYNTLFRYSDEIELLEEVKENSLKLRFKSYSDRISYADGYSVNKKVSSAIGNGVFEIPSNKLNREILIQDIKIKGVPIYKLCDDLFKNIDLTTIAFLKNEIYYLEIVDDEDESEPRDTPELLKGVHIFLDGEYSKSDLIELRDKLNRLIEEF